MSSGVYVVVTLLVSELLDDESKPVYVYYGDQKHRFGMQLPHRTHVPHMAHCRRLAFEMQCVPSCCKVV